MVEASQREITLRPAARPSRPERPRLLRRLWRINRLGIIGAVLLLLIVAVALLAPLLAPYAPEQIAVRERNRSPSATHLMGTDQLGRDVWSRTLYGARLSLAVAGGAIAAAGTVGVLVGTLAGARRGWVGALLMRLTDVVLALPTFFVLVALQTLLRPGVGNIILALALTGWMLPARLVYGQLVTLREREYILAARALGLPERRIIWRHLLPQTSGSLLVYLTLGAADAILIEAALSFLGLGIPPYAASWGTMLADAQGRILSGGWWMALFPGLAIFLTAFAINCFGDGLRDWLAG
jgi:peptide/nickel transport system permease protein